MCELCNGNTHQQLLETMHAHVVGGQWALQGIEAGSRSPAWIYTIGLSHNFANPELVIVDGDVAHDGALLNELGTQIARGLRIDAMTSVDLGGGYVVEFETVHDSYLAGGLCASWDAYNTWIGAQPGRLEVLQVVQPLSEWCGECDRRQRCLAVPGEPGFGDHRNRAARRTQSRRRRSP